MNMNYCIFVCQDPALKLFFGPNRCYLVFLFYSNCLQTLKIQHFSKPRAFLNSFEKNSFCLVLFLYALYAKEMRWNWIVSVLQTLHGLSLDNICGTCIITLLSGKFDAPVVITVTHPTFSHYAAAPSNSVLTFPYNRYRQTYHFLSSVKQFEYYKYVV